MTPTSTHTSTSTPTYTNTVEATPTESSTTCLPVDNSERRTLMDNTAKRQERVIKQALKGVTRVLSGKRDKRAASIRTEVKKIAEQAHKLQFDNWVISWKGPRTDDNCPQSPQSEICATFVYTELKEQYAANATQLREFLSQVIRIRKQVRRRYGRKGIGKAVRDRRLIARGDAEFKTALELNSQVPDSSKDC